MTTRCDDDFVFVVVDAQELTAEAPTAGCAVAADDTTGIDALEAAGFTAAGTTRFGRSLACRIDGEPADASCVDTPPADAYWSYWRADAGSCTWTYSQMGAAAHTVEPGAAEGWSFAVDAGPGDAPPPRIDPCDRIVTRLVREEAPAPADHAGPDGRIDPVYAIVLLGLVLTAAVVLRGAARRRRERRDG